MVETGFNKSEMGKIILAACFINDLGTVLALGIVFAHFDYWMALFGAVTAARPAAPSTQRQQPPPLLPFSIQEVPPMISGESYGTCSRMPKLL